MAQARIALVVHGHFYQPPRENPWTEEVAREPSAAPFHDWNARIAAESYRPNAFARILDEQGRVLAMVDNYERMSFDMGPTLLSWVERHQPEVYERMVAADRVAGGGMAQAFGHLILPLCNERDLRTQIRWGLADFRHRFGRDAEGMWLPEAAVNDDVLAALAEEGVAFTVLAPGQADLPEDEGPIDTAKAYRWYHPTRPDLSVDIVFYDGGLSHDLAFSLSALSSEAFVDRVEGAAARGGLVTVATDGETFGHHHHFGDRLLAYALAVEAPRRGMDVTNVARWLKDHPPIDEIAVKESSWSCAHGVGRWREDCGCSTGGEAGWNQSWRGPLRYALDLLRDHAASVFERRGKRVFTDDPWAVRDAYIDVLLGIESRDAFAARWVAPGSDTVEAFTLLEAQRHAMAMYTSCGWFFNDLAGLETVQVLRYAGRLIDLLAELGENTCESHFLDALAKAESNDPRFGNGRRIWDQQVLPARVDGARVVAHIALVELLEGRPPPARLAGYDVTVIDHERSSRGSFALCSGHVRLVHRRTGRARERVYAAVRIGGLEVFGASRPADPRRDASTLAFLRDVFAKGAEVITMLRMVNDNFGPREFGLESALPDGTEEILRSTEEALSNRFGSVFEQLFEQNRPALEKLFASGDPIPPVLRAPAELALARQLEAAVAAAAGSSDPAAYRDAVAVANAARQFGFSIDTPRAKTTIEELLLGAVERAAGDDVLALLRLAGELGLVPDVERAQEVAYEALLARPHDRSVHQIGDALGLAVDAIPSFAAGLGLAG